MLFRAGDASSSDDERVQERARARARARRRDPRARRRFALAKPRRARRPACGARVLVTAALLCLLAYELAVAHFARTGKGPARPLLQRLRKQHAWRIRAQQQRQQQQQQHQPQPQPRAVSGAVAAAQAERRPSADETRAQAIQDAAADAAPAPRPAAAAREKGVDSYQGLDVRPPLPGRGGAGALTTFGSRPGTGENFWEWFQATRSGAKIACPVAQRRLCEMTYKFVRKYKIRAMYDASCARNTAWMRVVLRQLSREVWGFRYVCAEPSSSRMRRARRALARLPFVSFSEARWWRAGFPPGVDLVFAWDVLAHTAYGRVWAFFVRVRKDGVKYVLVDNYPGILNDPSPERFYLNLRKHPFRFPAAREVVQNVTEQGESANRQLLFYEAESLPGNLG